VCGGTGSGAEGFTARCLDCAVLATVTSAACPCESAISSKEEAQLTGHRGSRDNMPTSS